MSVQSFSEQQAKFIEERINNVEKYFAEFCWSFAAYVRKAARLRDKNDELAQVIQSYANAETVNKSLNKALINFSTILLSLGDFKDARVQKLENKIVSELSQYDIICKHAKEEVKHTFILRDKELARKKQLDKIREKNPKNQHEISQAETEFVKASTEMSRTIRTLEDQTDEFEKQKLRNLKTILLDFVTIELAYHAKSLELLTKAYENVDNIDEKMDVDEFRNAVRMPEKLSRLEAVKRMSFSQPHSQSLTVLEKKQNPVKIQKQLSKSMESVDSYKINIDDDDSFTTSNDSSIPVPAPRTKM